MPTSVEKIIGAIQGMPWLGPRLVHAKPNNPIVSSGATLLALSLYKIISGGELTEKQPPQSLLGRDSVWIFPPELVEPMN